MIKGIYSQWIKWELWMLALLASNWVSAADFEVPKLKTLETENVA